MPYKLITDDDVKAFMKGATDTTFDALLNDQIIPGVGEAFANHCGRPDFDKAVRTEYFSPIPEKWNRQIFLACPPIANTPAVQLWEDASLPRLYGTGTEKTNGTDFFVHEDEGVIERMGWFMPGPKAVKVTYTGGYLTADATNCPLDLKLAACTQVKILFDRREEYGVTGRSLEGGSINMLNILTLPKQVTLLIDKYKIYPNAC